MQALRRSLLTLALLAVAPVHRVIRLVLLALLLASPAWAQYAPDQLRELQPVVLSVGEEVRAAYPSAWRAAHNAGEPAGSEYVRRWALALKARGITACVNGKRGSDTLSQDVLVFPVTSGGNRDTSGQYAQIAIIDVIGGAGGSNPTLGWNDVSQFAAGKCIAPVLEAGESGGTSAPTPVPVPAPPPPPTVDLSPVLVKLAAIEARLAAIEARDLSQPIDFTALDALPAYIDDMVGAGPAGDPALMPNHVTDIKMRLDVIRTQVEQLNGWVEQLNGWLRGRAVLRY